MVIIYTVHLLIIVIVTQIVHIDVLKEPLQIYTPIISELKSDLDNKARISLPSSGRVVSTC